MIFNYTTLDTVLEKVNSLVLFGSNYSPAEANEWAAEAILKIGVNTGLAYLSNDLEIKDGKVILPKGIETIDTILEEESGFPMEQVPIEYDLSDMSYKIYNGYIYTSFEEGAITIRYYGIAIENEKLLIPDAQYYLSAIEAYIKYKIGEKLYWMQKIVIGQFQMLERDWYFYCGAAKNAANAPDKDGLNYLKRDYLQMFPNINKNKRKPIRGNNFNVVNRTRI